MIDENVIREILSLYKKHGWNLRRILLSDELKQNLSASLERLFGEAEITPARFDAAWFSRASGKTGIAWELRHLSENPFAVFEVFEKDEAEENLLEKLFEMENRLENRLSNSK